MTILAIFIVSVVVAFIMGVCVNCLGNWLDKRKDDKIAKKGAGI